MTHYNRTQAVETFQTKTSPLVQGHAQRNSVPINPAFGPVDIGRTHTVGGRRLPYKLDSNFHRFPAQPALALQKYPGNFREISRAPSSGTYVVSSPVNQTQPIFVDQLVYSNNNSTQRQREVGPEARSNFTSADVSYNQLNTESCRKFNLKDNASRVTPRQENSLVSPQSSKIVRSSDNGSSLYSAIDHWTNYESGNMNRTTSESLNSRRGCRRIPPSSSKQLFEEEEINEIFMIPDRPPFEVPKVEHPKVLKIQMLDKMREGRSKVALFSNTKTEEDIPVKIRSDFEPKKLEFDQTNDNILDVVKLKNNLDNVYSRLRELSQYVDLN